MDGEDSLRCKFIVKIDPPPPVTESKANSSERDFKIKKKNRNS